MKKVNSIAVAKKAGVAQSTVSLVVNNSPRVAEETRKKVIQAARTLGYPLKPQDKRMLIGIVISRHHPINSWQMMMLSALKEEIYQKKYRMEIICNEDIPLLNERVVSGAISITTDPKLNQAWSQLKSIPLIRVNGFSSHSDNIFRILTDSCSDISKLYEYLYSMGHRKIGLFLNKTSEVERQEGLPSSDAFREILAMHGILNAEERISFRDERDTGIRLADFLKTGITAIIAVPGDTALILSRELCRLNLKIPDDVSLVTIEYTGVCENWNPPLTALLRDHQTMAKKAVEMLEKAYSRQAHLEDILIPGKLLIRESVKKINPQS